MHASREQTDRNHFIGEQTTAAALVAAAVLPKPLASSSMDSITLNGLVFSSNFDSGNLESVEALATSPANSRRRRLTATPPANNSSNTKHHNNATPTARVAHGGSGVWVADCTHFCYSAGFWALQLHALVTTLAEKLH